MNVLKKAYHCINSKLKNMKRIYGLRFLAFAFIFAACSTTKQSTGVWVNKEKAQGKSFNNFFILVMTANIQARVQLEKDLEALAVSRGLKATKSIDVMPPNLDDPKKVPTKEELVSKVKASGCDAVFMVGLLSKDESVRYTPSTSAYTVTPYYSYTGSYYGYYSNWYSTAYTSSYYTQEKSYFMETNLYDVASEEIMWSAQSEVFTPSDLPHFSRSYIQTLMKQLDKENLLKK